MHEEDKVTYFAETDARNKRIRFGIKAKDRARHVYSIGKTGMGKSTLLENLAIQDIQNGEGLAFIDPHGKSADLLLEYIPEHRKKDVVYFAPFDLDFPIAFNALEDVGVTKRYLVANGLMSAFKTIWVDAFSARMEYILNNIMLALLEYPGSTLMSVNRMLTDKDFRATVVANVTDPTVKAFWIDEYGKYTEKFAAEAAPAIQNKVGQFVGNPLVRNIIGQPVSGFDIRDIMDNKKILIINLSKGLVGEANANLLGAMLITKIYLAAMSRADLKEDELKKAPQFYLYVDEFQSFANETFADILSEARKYKLCLTIAHQYVEQMTEDVRAAVFGNVGTMITFRVGAYDAAIFEKEYSPEFTAEDLVNLQQYQMYLKLMIDGVTSRPFSAIGIPPIAKPEISYVDEIINLSRSQFANPRETVEENIRNWHEQKIKPVGSAGSSSSGGASGSGSGSGATSSTRSSSREKASSGERAPSRGFGAENRGADGHRIRNDSRNISNISASNSSGGRAGDQNGRDAGRDAGHGGRLNASAYRSENLPEKHVVEVEKRVAERHPHNHPHKEDIKADIVEKTEPIKTEHIKTDVKSLVNEAQKESEEKKESVENLERKFGERAEENEIKSVSLNNLSNGHSQLNKSKNNQKVAKPENVEALRNALLSVMGDKDKEKVEDRINKKPDGSSTEEFVAKIEEEKKGEIKPEEKPDNPGALSTDELKRILDID